jgi:hypothetical protein
LKQRAEGPIAMLEATVTQKNLMCYSGKFVLKFSNYVECPFGAGNVQSNEILIHGARKLVCMQLADSCGRKVASPSSRRVTALI